ncbi:MAG: AAA family ATPase [Oligoflexia bacterium]|nr:AAA family ATPase [Oligoflexia bacterium]
MFVGRDAEIERLNSSFKLNKSQLMVVYGRRRIGKSEMLKRFCKNKNHWFFDGLERQRTTAQIDNCMKVLSNALINEKFVSKIKFKTWSEFFDFLTECIRKQKKKMIIVFDEFQWLACQQSHLPAYLKHYWDNYWKDLNVQIILCGSIASYMVKKVIRSKALYGRINLEIGLKGLKPHESRKMLNKRGELEVLQYLMVLGTIPKYLDDINQNKSLDENLNQLCFVSDGGYVDEIDKVFFSQFKETRNYKRIVELLSKGNYSLTEISKKLKIISGGGLRGYLDNLEKAGFIRSCTSIDNDGPKDKKFKLFDEFLIFHFKFIEPNLKIIKENESRNIFKTLVRSRWQPWLGIAFKTFCLKHALYLAERAGFAEDVLSYAPYFARGENNFQIDLIFKRSNNIYVLCEIKFADDLITPTIITQIEKKCYELSKRLKSGVTIEKMLITTQGMNSALRSSRYFHHCLTLKDIF